MAELGVVRRSAFDPRGNKNDAVKASKQKLFSLRMVYTTPHNQLKSNQHLWIYELNYFLHQLRERIIALSEETVIFALQNTQTRNATRKAYMK